MIDRYYIPDYLVPTFDLKKWLSEDGFNSSDIPDNRKYLLVELEKVKQETIDFFYHGKGLEGLEYSYMHIYTLLGAYRLKVKKLRMIILFDTYFSFNKPTHDGNKYPLLRSYWLDRNGKKIKKFHVYLSKRKFGFSGSVIPDDVLKFAKRELERKMWSQYKNEYENLDLIKLCFNFIK